MNRNLKYINVSRSTSKIDGISLDLLQVPQTSDFGFIVDNNLKSSAQVVKAVSKARCMLPMLIGTFARLIPEVFIPAESTFIRSQLEHCFRKI